MDRGAKLVSMRADSAPIGTQKFPELFVPNHKMVAMHHLGPAAISADRQNVGRGAALDPFGLFRVVSYEATGDLNSIRTADDHRVTARERAIDADDPHGQ